MVVFNVGLSEKVVISLDTLRVSFVTGLSQVRPAYSPGKPVRCVKCVKWPLKIRSGGWK